MTTSLQRAGTRQPQVGDLTGNRQLAAQEEADERAAVRERLAKALADPDVAFMYIRVDGRGLVPVDKDAYAAIKRSLGR